MNTYRTFRGFAAVMTVPLLGGTIQAQNDKTIPYASKVPGVVICHSPASTECYIGSPSIAILPDGTYVASHDLFGPKSACWRSASSRVYSSKDKGRTWQKIADISPLMWAKLFLHKQKLYILGTSCQYGNLLIRRSDDGGRTWTKPDNGNTGLLSRGRYHCAPCRILVHDGRIWRSVEDFPGTSWGYFRTMVISAPVNADLMNAESWTFSDAKNWIFGQRLPTPKQNRWLEGNVILGPDGKIVNVLRTNGCGADKAAIVHVQPNGVELVYDQKNDFIDMPGGGAKFTIRYDKQTSRYWSIVDKQTPCNTYRNDLVLVSSADLRTWKVESPLLYHPDSKKHAWQYIDWQFEDEDIIFVSRTAFDDGLGGANNAHNANYLTFHRIKNFRNRKPGLLTD